MEIISHLRKTSSLLHQWKRANSYNKNMRTAGGNNNHLQISENKIGAAGASNQHNMNISY